jgi:hypothetical protein
MRQSPSWWSLLLAVDLVSMAAFAVFPAAAAKTDPPAEPPSVTQEMTVDEMREMQEARMMGSDYLYGTDYFVAYLLALEDHRFQVGDRVRFNCRILSSDGASAPCDSVEIAADLGDGQLPIGLEWALLSPADWSAPLETRQELLDSRFLHCGGDPRGVHFLQIAIVDCDSSGRLAPSNAEKRKALRLLQNEEYPAAAELLARLLQREPDSILLRVCYAHALALSDQCEAYADQAADLAKRGYGQGLHRREKEFSYCRGWNGHRDDAKSSNK